MDSLTSFKELSAKLLIITKLLIYCLTKFFINIFKMIIDLLILLKVFAVKLVLTLLEIALISYSIGKKVVTNILMISMKMIKNWSLKKFRRRIAFLILFYQIISVTINYLEYETVIDMKAVADLENEPTISFCLKNNFEFPKKVKNIFIRHAFKSREPIGCQLRFQTKSSFMKCNNLTKIIESVHLFLKGVFHISANSLIIYHCQ
jgi:hypothetical protein